MLRPISLAALIVACGACAQHPKSIKPTLISPAEYAGRSCQELNDAQLAAWKRKEDVRKPLKSAAEDMPFFGAAVQSSDLRAEFADLEGRLQAIQFAAFAHDCEIDSIEELKAAYGLDGREKPRWPSDNPRVSP